MIATSGIYGFKEYPFLSNMYMCPVPFDGRIWRSSEHAYMQAKTLDRDIKDKIFDMEDPKAVKRFCKTIKLREDWDDVKFQTMYLIVLSKFLNNEDILEKLLATGDCYIEETNFWKDTYWGVCKGVGQNNLGKILMNVREKLRND